MRHFIALPFIVFVGLLPRAAMPQNDAPAVPIEKAPFHLPVFKNEFVTVLKIDVPPHRKTGFHTHTAAAVSVNIEEADMANQMPGEKPGPPQRSKRGQPSFTAYSQQPPRTHQP